jgi:hypothetical protein
MGFFNKIDDLVHSGLSKLDDGVNDTIGWDKIAAMTAMYFGMPTGGIGGTSGAGGFEFLPSGEMTVFSPEAASSAGGSGNFLSNLFGGSSELAPLNPNDYSRAVEMYPTSSGNIFEPSGMSPNQISSIQNMGDQALLRDQLSSRQRMPNFGQQSQQQAEQQLNQLNQGNESGGMRKGKAIPMSQLAGLLNPQSAVKAYRPTLL